MNELKEIRERALAGNDIRKIVKENINKISEAYELVMRFSYQARSEGLLAMEYEAGRIPKDMSFSREIGNMVEDVVEGTNPELVAEWMTLRFLSENYQGLDALLYFLYARGILLIQADESTYRIERFFQAVIPQDILPFDRWQRAAINQNLKMAEEVKDTLSEQEKSYLHSISEDLFSLTEAEWNDILQTKAFYTIDKAVPYLDRKVQALVWSHVNENRYYAIMRSITAIEEQEICQCHEKLKLLLKEMREKPEEKSILSDLLLRSDEEMKKLIAELDMRTIALALKGESKEVSERFFRNMPIRKKYRVQDEIEYMGPVRKCDVEESQRQICRMAEEMIK